MDLLEFLGPVGGLFSVAVLLAGLTLGPPIVACLAEPRLVWPYLTADELDWPPAPLTRRAERSNAALAARGFAPFGVYYDGKGRGYRLRYDFWLSPDRQVLGMVGGGRLFGIPLNAVLLFSRLADGRCLLTVNTRAACEPDPARLLDGAVVRRGDVPGVLARHRDRLAAEAAAAVPYSADDPLADHAAFLRAWVEALVAGGYAGYLDDEQTAWKYTPKGAVVFALRGAFAT